MQELIVELWYRIQPTIFCVTHSITEAVYLGERVWIFTPGARARSPTISATAFRRRAGIPPLVAQERPEFKKAVRVVTEAFRRVVRSGAGHAGRPAPHGAVDRRDGNHEAGLLGLRSRRLQRPADRDVRPAQLDRPGGSSRCWACSTRASGCWARGWSWATSTRWRPTARFQRLVDGQRLLGAAQRQWQAGSERRSPSSTPTDQRRVPGAWSAVPGDPRAAAGPRGAAGWTCTAQGEGLGRLLWIYLRLLLTRQAIQPGARAKSADRGRRPPAAGGARSAQLQEQLKDADARRGPAQEPHRPARDPPAAAGQAGARPATSWPSSRPS